VLASTPGLQSVPSGTKYDIGLRLSWQDFGVSDAVLLRIDFVENLHSRPINTRM
jgi:hypothetical protein